MKLISYVDADKRKEELFFYNANVNQVEDITIVKGGIDGKPSNSCKIRALSCVKEEIKKGYCGLIFLCDIDTRLVRLRNVQELMKGHDLAVYSRSSLPLNLAFLSGFLILNVNKDNMARILEFVDRWRSRYMDADADWYADQETLAVAILSSAQKDRLKVCALNTLKSKMKFNWTTQPSILSDACTHKGKDWFAFYNTQKVSIPLLLIFDTLLILPNRTVATLRRLWNTI